MTSPPRGRPRASSHETIADAATELFLEQGYEATSVTEITRRAGVSRSSFFNYFAGKSDILWFVLDRRIDAVLAALARPEVAVRDGLALFADGATPDTLALAIVDARTMGVEGELAAGRAERQLRLAAAIAARLAGEAPRDPARGFRAEITGAGYAAALFAAVWHWAQLGAGRHRLDEIVAAALAAARTILE
ncbi:TetR family transcriptional regulator [Leucobacter luti]|uniref:TetR/AcrR family transcriptional regulator n=1 Tax=Leucobacter luti TaxID=340320 RepID=UPI001043426A|nr:helix-turn-helix domain-containing protein [Leucobacter luti]MCW2288427.1 AcrR family transcriptional regulator [Leucobacter luti]TCK45416.1 TetR family transcriptional regulator [Leucobacter luti]